MLWWFMVLQNINFEISMEMSVLGSHELKIFILNVFWTEELKNL